jgi:hypothetical protein
MHSLHTTNGQSHTEWPVWFSNSRSLQNSINRDTRKATRVSFGSGFFASDLPRAARSGFATICKN